MNRKHSVILIPLLVVVVYLTWWFVSGSAYFDNDAEATQTVTESSEPTDQAPSDPLHLIEAKDDLDARVEAFIPLYFNRDPLLTRDAHRERVSGFVTASFLANHSFGLLTPPDQVLAKEGIRVEAALHDDSVLGHLSSDVSAAELEVTIEIRTYDREGEELSSNSYVQPMAWLKTKSGWKADSLY